MSEAADFFSIQNYIDLPSTTITPENDDIVRFESSNLKDRNIDSRWRNSGLVTGSTSFYIDIEFDTDKAIGFFGLLTPRANNAPLGDFHLSINETDTVQWQFDLKAGTFGTGAVYDTGAIAAGVIAGYGYHAPPPVYTGFEGASHKFTAGKVRITVDAVSRAEITGPAGTEKGFADISRIWIGDRIDPPYNHAFRHREGWDSESLIVRAPRTRASSVNRGSHYRFLSVVYEGITDDEQRNIWRPIDRLASNDSQFVYGRSRETADSATEIMFCERTNADDGMESAGPDFWMFPLEVEESL